VPLNRDMQNDLPTIASKINERTRAVFLVNPHNPPHADFAASLLKEGVDIGRAFPPYDRWARISVGLPEENDVARAAVRKMIQRP
jgi:histidinol-phosphate aminotransferase